ncbi:MAG: NUDIX domain-containing protein, partial [Proteobacteria bacterium]|nr:NUDIX domain-containing protein [Pseudomonadota bacterium]
MTSRREISAGGVVFRRVTPENHDKTGAKIPEKTNSCIEVALISVKNGKLWGLPKGLQEEGEKISFTAHREVKEETGLDGKILSNLGHVEYFFTFREEDGTTRKVFKIVYFFLMEYVSGSVEDHDWEVDECRWFEIENAIETLK